MTYCVGMLLDRGLALMSDTRTNSGVDNISTFRKMCQWTEPGERIVAVGGQPQAHGHRDALHPAGGVGDVAHGAIEFVVAGGPGGVGGGRAHAGGIRDDSAQWIYRAGSDLIEQVFEVRGAVSIRHIRPRLDSQRR